MTSKQKFVLNAGDQERIDNYWADIRAKILAKNYSQDTHKYKNNETSDHAWAMCNRLLDQAAEWALRARAIDQEPLT